MFRISRNLTTLSGQILVFKLDLSGGTRSHITRFSRFLYRISNRPVISALLQKRPVTARSRRRTGAQEGTARILFLHSAEVRDTHESGVPIPD